MFKTYLRSRLGKWILGLLDEAGGPDDYGIGTKQPGALRFTVLEGTSLVAVDDLVDLFAHEADEIEEEGLFEAADHLRSFASFLGGLTIGDTAPDWAGEQP